MFRARNRPIPMMGKSISCSRRLITPDGSQKIQPITKRRMREKRVSPPPLI
jgi:hypothetical protein